MFKAALRSIRDDFSRSLFYWLTFVLTSMFMFLFFNISYNEKVGVTFINSKNDMATFITVFVIGICMVVIFFANDFFAKKKAKDMAVRLVCGSTYLQIAKFLLYQSAILLIVAIPTGIILAILFIPVINIILNLSFHTDLTLTIQLDAISSTALILVIVIFYSTILNLGYAYRNSIHTLINEERLNIKSGVPVFSFNFKLSKKTKKIISTLLFFLPIFMFYIYGNDSKNLLAFSIIGILGFFMFLNNVFIPFLNKLTHILKTDNSTSLVYLGFIRTNIIVLKKNIILLIISAIFFVSLLIASLNNPLEMILAYISFTTINILLSLSIMFKYSTEIAVRKKYYLSLERIGYTKEVLQTIIKKEVYLFYFIIICFSLLYISNMIISLILHHIINTDMLILLTLSFIIPLLLCAIINHIYYKKTIIK